jgi:hypothetical protein
MKYYDLENAKWAALHGKAVDPFEAKAIIHKMVMAENLNPIEVIFLLKGKNNIYNSVNWALANPPNRCIKLVLGRHDVLDIIHETAHYIHHISRIKSILMIRMALHNTPDLEEVEHDSLIDQIQKYKRERWHGPGHRAIVDKWAKVAISENWVKGVL